MKEKDKNCLHNGVNTEGQTIEEKTKELEQNFLNIIGTFYKTKRDEKNISQRELNKLSHVGLGVIADLEKANNMPRIETLIRLALALEFEINDVHALLNAISPNKNSNKVSISRDKELLSEIIKQCNYSKEEASEIADYLKYVEYKRVLKMREKLNKNKNK